MIEARALDAQQIIRAYLNQVIVGCDSFHCDNQYCKSCDKFLFKDKTENERIQEAIALAKNHVQKDCLCHNMLTLYLDCKSLEQQAKDFLAMIQAANFDDVCINLDKEKLTTLLSNCPLLPFLFMPNNRFIDDQLLLNLYQYIQNNIETEPFSSLKPLIPQFIKFVTSPFNQKYPMFDTKYHINQILTVLILLSLFPIYDYSEDLYKILEHLTKLMDDKALLVYTQERINSIPRVNESLLFFAQENVTYAQFAFKQDDPKLLLLVRYVQLIRDSCPSISSHLFVNEPLTLNLDPKNQMVNLFEKRLSFLQYPSILTLSFKFKCLEIFYLNLQFSVNNPIEILQLLQDPTFTITVSRNNLTEDTMKQLKTIDPNQASKHLKVVFLGESGIDAGGVSREFFHLICKDVFSEQYGMFYRLNNGKYWFTSPTAGILIDFRSLGLLVILAVYNSIILPVRFPTLLYKKLFHMDLSINDYEEIDPEIVATMRKLRKMKANNEDLSLCDLTFSITRDNFGVLEEIELCEGGANKEVTNENLEEYIKLYMDWLMNKSVEKMFSKFEDGFNLISKARGKTNSVKIMYELFHYDEIDLLVSGEEITYWNSLKDNAEYIDGYKEDSQEVKWFWEIFDEMSEEEKHKFFRFSTGCDRAPVGGLNNFSLKIQKINDDTKLPVAHTCMNTFSLPTYKSKEIMKSKILVAIEYTEGFGLI